MGVAFASGSYHRQQEALHHFDIAAANGGDVNRPRRFTVQRVAMFAEVDGLARIAARELQRAAVAAAELNRQGVALHVGGPRDLAASLVAFDEAVDVDPALADAW